MQASDGPASSLIFPGARCAEELCRLVASTQTKFAAYLFGRRHGRVLHSLPFCSVDLAWLPPPPVPPAGGRCSVGHFWFFYAAFSLASHHVPPRLFQGLACSLQVAVFAADLRPTCWPLFSMDLGLLGSAFQLVGTKRLAGTWAPRLDPTETFTDPSRKGRLAAR